MRTHPSCASVDSMAANKNKQVANGIDFTMALPTQHNHVNTTNTAPVFAGYFIHCSNLSITKLQ